MRYLTTEKETEIMRTIVSTFVLLCIAFIAPASSLAASDSPDLWKLSGYTQVIKDLTDRSVPAVLFGARQKPSIAAFVSVRNWHSADKKIVYAQSGFAGKFQDGATPSFHAVPLTVNIFALTAKVLEWEWALKHSTAQPMPNIFLGVASGLRLDGNVTEHVQGYRLIDNTYLMMYFRGG